MDRKRRFIRPTEALVQFECDGKIDIRPVKSIIDESDSILEGNVVTLTHGGQSYRVKIIRLAGNSQ